MPEPFGIPIYTGSAGYRAPLYSPAEWRSPPRDEWRSPPAPQQSGMPSPNLRRKPTGTIDPINVPAPALQRGPSPTPTGAAVASADPKSSGPSAPPNVPKIPLIQEIKDFLATAEGGKVFHRECSLTEFEIFNRKAEEGLFGLNGEKIK
ncbi:hypothetical protein NLJ89_g12153 [Agrocybe chaxingu]|uniref:Uncharacterized protein n=1 Tax=Agrocybe chaxingu TaxID=84603 RepID=A0A9W8JME4_9AGAR|nr:hypothetical protein NLJ89_g12153 [Agrocybe chaxingu]